MFIYRNRIYYYSLAFGFGGAGCFLGLTLLAKVNFELFKVTFILFLNFVR
jgi:hypothetical protein